MKICKQTSTAENVSSQCMLKKNIDIAKGV
jgi:hypothetical protein